MLNNLRNVYFHDGILLHSFQKRSERIVILLPFPLLLPLFAFTLSLKSQQSGKKAVNYPYILASVSFIWICMYLFDNFLYSRLNFSRGNSVYMFDLWVTWIFQAGASLFCFPQYKLPQMCVLYRAIYKCFFCVESWLHLRLTVNLKIQILNFFKIHFEKCAVNCSETRAPQVEIFANVLIAGIKNS